MTPVRSGARTPVKIPDRPIRRYRSRVPPASRAQALPNRDLVDRSLDIWTDERGTPDEMSRARILSAFLISVGWFVRLWFACLGGCAHRVPGVARLEEVIA